MTHHLRKLTSLICITSMAACQANVENNTSETNRQPTRGEDNIRCISTILSDKGPTTLDEIENALPYGLRLGMTLDDLEKNSELRPQKNQSMDAGVVPFSLKFRDKNKSPLGFGAHAFDIDADGKVDWYQISTMSSDSDSITKASRDIKGGRTTIPSPLDIKNCPYKKRTIFYSSRMSPTDADVGEWSYCLQKRFCSISDRQLCVSHPNRPILRVDNRKDRTSIILEGHGRYKPPESPIKLGPETPRCLFDITNQKDRFL
jgi:hypothetical protein